MLRFLVFRTMDEKFKLIISETLGYDFLQHCATNNEGLNVFNRAVFINELKKIVNKNGSSSGSDIASMTNTHTFAPNSTTTKVNTDIKESAISID